MSDPCREQRILPLRFGRVNEVQRPDIVAGDVVRLYARSEVAIAGCFAGWATNYQEGVVGSLYDVFIGDLTAPVGADGFASSIVASTDQRPIVCPTFAGLGASLIVDLRGLPVETNGQAWVHIFPAESEFWGI